MIENKTVYFNNLLTVNTDYPPTLCLKLNSSLKQFKIVSESLTENSIGGSIKVIFCSK